MGGHAEESLPETSFQVAPFPGPPFLLLLVHKDDVEVLLRLTSTEKQYCLCGEKESQIQMCQLYPIAKDVVTRLQSLS